MALAVATALLFSLAPRLALDVAPPPPSPETELQQALKAREAQLEEELGAIVAKAEHVAQPTLPMVLGSGAAYALLYTGAVLTLFGGLLALLLPVVETGVLIAIGIGGGMLALGVAGVIVLYEVDSGRLEEKHALEEEQKRVEQELKNIRLRETSAPRSPAVPLFSVAF